MLAALALAALLETPAPPQPPAAGVEIAIQGRAIELPPLPGSPAEAQSAFPALRPRIAGALQELERDLADLHAALAPEGPAGASYRLPELPSEETRFLDSMLQDEASRSLEDGLLDRWLQWQTQLLRLGLAAPGGGSAVTSRMVLLALRRHELRPRDHEGQPWPLFDLLAVNGFDYTGRSALARSARELAEARAPLLAEAWKPLARRLSEEALRMLEFERGAPPAADPALRTLRLQAKVNVLERFRRALWICQTVWAHLASAPLPPPPRPIP